MTLAQILANSSNSPTSRTAAGLFLKNQLTSKDPADKLLKQQRWAAFKLETRKTVRELVSLNSRVGVEQGGAGEAK